MMLKDNCEFKLRSCNNLALQRNALNVLKTY